MAACSEEKMIPEPPPPPPPVEEIDSLVISPTLEVQGYSNKKNRLGAGDYTCDTLFIISNLPNGNWEYTLSLGESIQAGIIQVNNETAKIPNQQKEENWLKFLVYDSICIHITLYSDDFIMAQHEDSFTFKNEAYKIRTWQDLQAMRYDLMGNYELQNDITFPEPATEGFPEQGFLPIGTAGPSSAFLINAFKGSLNGFGYKIVNFSIDRADLNYVGLFGVLADATIKDISLEISSKGISGGNYVGAISGYIAQKSTIENCKVIGNINGLNQVGGIAGEININSVISLSRTTGNIKGINYVGGIVGKANQGSNISTSFVEGIVNGNNYLGGLVGQNKSTIYNSQSGGQTNNIQIIGKSFTGGLCGYNNGEIIGCRVINGRVEGEINLGGIIGYADSLSLCQESCSKINIKGDSRVGGLVGYNKGIIDNSYALGQVEGGSFVGGLVGEFFSQATNSYVSIDVIGSSTSSSGAFMGSNNGTMTNCYYDEEKKTPSRSVGNDDSDFGLEPKSQTDFLNFSALQIPRNIFVGWDFKSVWENEVPLANNEKYPGLKREFNFE